MLSCLGIRQIQTFKNEPILAPKTNRISGNIENMCQERAEATASALSHTGFLLVVATRQTVDKRNHRHEHRDNDEADHQTQANDH